MANNRQIFFKLEKLDHNESVLEEKSITVSGGRIDVGSGGARRKCTFDLLEPLDIDWQGRRWKLYYGYRIGSVGDTQWFPQGVYIPINPKEQDRGDRKITSMQGTDKMKLFTDYEMDEPITFTSGTPVRNIVTTVAGWVNETKLSLDADLGTLGADLTFEEGGTAESLINTLLSSFSAEAYYDVNGFLVARKQTDPKERPVKVVLDDIEEPHVLTAETDVDDSNYYNKVTVVGGTVDTDIFRATVQDDAAIARAKRVSKRYFTIDAAVTQTQVDGRAAYYLSNGVLTPRQLRLTSLVLPNLEIGDIVVKEGRRYAIRSFDVPFSTGSQNMTAGEITI